jgi:hypothetical protein
MGLTKLHPKEYSSDGESGESTVSPNGFEMEPKLSKKLHLAQFTASL